MSSAKNHPDRRSSDGTPGSNSDRRNQDTNGSGTSQEHGLDGSTSGNVGSIGHDARGNRIWEWSPRLQRRRVDDQTLDCLKALGGEDLALAIEQQPAKKRWWRFWDR